MVKTQLLIIQPTSLCNLNCHYCYLPFRHIKQTMSMDTISTTFRRFFASPFAGNEITVVWHAGEPLVLSPEYYDEAFRRIEQENKRGVRVIHSFQTNGTCIDEQWCRLFQQYQVQIGVSIDGPEHLHDTHRRDYADHGTFTRVMQGINLLKFYHIPFTSIAVVTEQTLNYGKEFWQFFQDLGCTRLGLNPEAILGLNKASSLAQSPAFLQYKAFLQQLFQLNAQSTRPLYIRELAKIIDYIHTCTPRMRSQSNVAGVILNVDYAGNFSTFSPEMLTNTTGNGDAFHFGNVWHNEIMDMLTHPQFQVVQQEIEKGVRQCQTDCDYFLFCGGGFPANKLYEHGTFIATETLACRLRVKATADVVLAQLEAQFGISSEVSE